MITEIAARVDLRLAEGVMRVQPELLRPTTGEMLDGQCDRRAWIERAALQVLDQRLDNIGVQVGIFGERFVDAEPTRLGREVGHVAVHPT